MSNMGLEVRSRESEVSIQETGDYFMYSSHTPHPTPHTPPPHFPTLDNSPSPPR
ncbi:hypothetical protein [Microcystis sp. LE19-59.1C]|uniref:hypothetical protein n=1 Tax=Microcystis sp. LE19-59.1C TaxID=3016442 RepID=UPI0022C6366A|nr:hypothetical protein [Microcystis sp. LE19-59.1C]MCZ8287921.1 hypothetical protein [Microcystis sp. LE19-59.1C]